MLTIHQSNGHRVGYRSTISGHVHPPTTRVQLLVHSADDEWYLQAPPRVTALGHWSILAVFGCLDGPGHPFEIVAIVADSKIVTRHVHEVPPAEQSSRVVRVVREG